MLDPITTAEQARRALARIAQSIDAIERELFKDRRPEWTGIDYQAARARNPALAARLDALIRARVQMEIIRDRLATHHKGD